MTNFPVTFEDNAFDDDYSELAQIEEKAITKVLATFKNKLDHESITIANIQEQSGQKTDPMRVLKEVICSILLRNIDKLWQEHLLSIDHLRTEVNMRVVGQKDPLLEFKHESFELFDAFSQDLKLHIAHSLFKFQMIPPQESSNPLQNLKHKKKKPSTNLKSPDSKLYLPSSPIIGEN